MEPETQRKIVVLGAAAGGLYLLWNWAKGKAQVEPPPPTPPIPPPTEDGSISVTFSVDKGILDRTP